MKKLFVQGIPAIKDPHLQGILRDIVRDLQDWDSDLQQAVLATDDLLSVYSGSLPRGTLVYPAGAGWSEADTTAIAQRPLGVVYHPSNTTQPHVKKGGAAVVRISDSSAGLGQALFMSATPGTATVTQPALDSGVAYIGEIGWVNGLVSGGLVTAHLQFRILVEAVK